MPTNIEVKAKMGVTEEKAIEIALSLNSAEAEIPDMSTLLQEDIFFNCNHGRLKLRREIQDDKEIAVLIAYERPDVTGPKRSDYVKTVIPHPDELEEALTRALGVKEKVSKTRLLAIVEVNGLRSRIHLDDVEGLGHFIEFEVMIEKDEDLGKGEEVAKYLSEAFQIKPEDHIDGAYVDSIIEKSQ